MYICIRFRQACVEGRRTKRTAVTAAVSRHKDETSSAAEWIADVDSLHHRSQRSIKDDQAVRWKLLAQSQCNQNRIHDSMYGHNILSCIQSASYGSGEIHCRAGGRHVRRTRVRNGPAPHHKSYTGMCAGLIIALICGCCWAYSAFSM